MLKMVQAMAKKVARQAQEQAAVDQKARADAERQLRRQELALQEAKAQAVREKMERLRGGRNPSPRNRLQGAKIALQTERADRDEVEWTAMAVGPSGSRKGKDQLKPRSKAAPKERERQIEDAGWWEQKRKRAQLIQQAQQGEHHTPIVVSDSPPEGTASRLKSVIVKSPEGKVESSDEASITESAHAVCDRSPDRLFAPVDMQGQESQIVKIKAQAGPFCRRPASIHVLWGADQNQYLPEMEEGFGLAAKRYQTRLTANQLVKYRRWYGHTIAEVIQDDDPERERKIQFAFEHLPNPADQSDSPEPKLSGDPSLRWPNQISSLEESSCESPLPEDFSKRAQEHRARKHQRAVRNEAKWSKARRLDELKAAKSRKRKSTKALTKERDRRLDPKRHARKKAEKCQRKAEQRRRLGMSAGRSSPRLGTIPMTRRWGNWGNSSSSDGEDTTRPARFKIIPELVEKEDVKEPEQQQPPKGTEEEDRPLKK